MKSVIQERSAKILIVFHNMIVDLIILLIIVIELFIRGMKLNISSVFTAQSYFQISKEVRLNTKHFFIMKIPKK